MADIGYVTDYASKKLFGEYAKKEYQDRGRETPFHINGQGLGLAFALKNADRLKRTNFSYINGQKIGLPKYLRDKLESQITVETKMSRIARLKAENGFLLKEYYKKYPTTPLDAFPRRFADWYDSHRFEYANQIFENFLQREKMRGNEL